LLVIKLAKFSNWVFRGALAVVVLRAWDAVRGRMSSEAVVVLRAWDAVRGRTSSEAAQ
jgi:hypothetical protein